MSYKDYQQSREIAIMDFPYYAMVMAAYRTEDAGRENCTKIENEWPTAFRRAYDTEVGIVARNSNPEYTFQAWIMALCRKSDTKNTAIIQRCWPEIWAEMQARYNSPGGILRGETV
jgi:hypothetical protein